MNSQGLNFNLTIFNCLIAVTMLELLGMLRRSHYSGISTSRGYNFPVTLHFKGLSDFVELATRCSLWFTNMNHNCQTYVSLIFYNNML